MKTTLTLLTFVLFLICLFTVIYSHQVISNQNESVDRYEKAMKNKYKVMTEQIDELKEKNLDLKEKLDKAEFKYAFQKSQNKDLLNQNKDLVETQNASRYDDRCVMYDQEGYFLDLKKSNVNGLYFPHHDYYCVWVKGRTLSEQESTDMHESCHSLVQNDNEHFCEKSVGWE